MIIINRAKNKTKQNNTIQKNEFLLTELKKKFFFQVRPHQIYRK